MSSNNKLKKTQNNKKEDGHFKKVTKKHGPAESARDVFGCPSDCERSR